MIQIPLHCDLSTRDEETMRFLDEVQPHWRTGNIRDDYLTVRIGTAMKKLISQEMKS